MRYDDIDINSNSYILEDTFSDLSTVREKFEKAHHNKIVEPH